MKKHTDEELDAYQAEHARKHLLRHEPPKSLLTKGSSPVKVEVQDPTTGEWRTKIRMSRTKFDNDLVKGVFLREYMKWGRMTDAAAAAGCSPQTIRKAMEEDDEFAQAVALAEDHYRDKLISHHQDLVFNGTEKITYNKEGAIVGTETIYPIRLIELELKKHDKGYRDKQEVDITHKGGVLVAPADTPSIDDWEKRFANMKTVNPDEE